MIKRVIWIVLDSVGMGLAQDAKDFGDEGANTIKHTWESCHGLALKTLRKLGYGNIQGMEWMPGVEQPIGAFGRLRELSAGKDTTIGHWEMIGIHTTEPFPTYPQGFPEDIIKSFIAETNCKGVLGNCVASGTAILEELGQQHIETGYPIVYTSVDSVFQIAACEEIIPVETLYRWCGIARELLKGKHNVARVIARPFVYEAGEYTRTANRRDFSRKPPKHNLLNELVEQGYPVVGVGKIQDIFDGEGITESQHTKNNLHGMEVTRQYMKQVEAGLIFTNLVEFDSAWGHRRNPIAYGKGLEEFDEELAKLVEDLMPEDLLIITADHGCDPTYKGTDHTREDVPVVYYSKHDGFKAGTDLGVGESFSNIGATIGDLFGLEALAIGTSCRKELFL